MEHLFKNQEPVGWSSINRQIIESDWFPPAMNESVNLMWSKKKHVWWTWCRSSFRCFQEISWNKQQSLRCLKGSEYYNVLCIVCTYVGCMQWPIDLTKTDGVAIVFLWCSYCIPLPSMWGIWYSVWTYILCIWINHTKYLGHYWEWKMAQGISGFRSLSSQVLVNTCLGQGGTGPIMLGQSCWVIG